MSILIDKGSRILVQGITGKLGMAETARMVANGTNVVAGVSPGRGGREVCGVPVFDRVDNAVAMYQPNVCANFVPAHQCLGASMEVLKHGIPLLSVAAEHVPIHDCARMVASAKEAGTALLGPNSLGIASPGKAFLGGMGAQDASVIFAQGHVGVVSKSGGMGVEVCWSLTRSGFGQSSFVALGGERICGLGFGDILKLFEADDETRAIVILGEAGAPYELEAVKALADGEISKPVVCLIAGKCVERFPGTKFGHGGAIVEQDAAKATEKRRLLDEAGASVVDLVTEIPVALKDMLEAPT